MANEKNLIPQAHVLTVEEQSQGGKRSGEVRREKATFKKVLDMLLDEKSKNGKTYREMIMLGQIKNAINGKAENFKILLELAGEMQEERKDTPSVEVNIVDNSKLESVLYEDQD